MLLVLSAKPEAESGKGTQEKIKSLLQKNGVPFVYAHFDDVCIVYSTQGITCTIKNHSASFFDTIYIRLMGRNRAIAYSVAQEVASNGGRVIDGYIADPAVLAGYKLGEMHKYAEAGIPIPKTVAYNGLIKNTVSIFESILSYPFVVKSLSNSQGKGVYLVATRGELVDSLKKLKHDKKSYIAQEYIDNLFEYRVLVLGGKSKIIEKKTRTKEGEFRNNVSLGATEEFFDIQDAPAAVLKLAEAAAKTVQVDVGGVDIIYDEITGTGYVLEVNPAPQMSFDDPESQEVDELVSFISCKKKI